jgi:signal transduction histidine kinase
MEMEEIFRIAAQASSMSAVRDVLETIASATGSYGCILWRVAPHAPPDEPQSLFVASEWFEDGRFSANHALSFNTSVTGRSIQANQQVVDVATELREPDRFLAQSGITWLCATPLTFGDGAAGSLNLYGRDSNAPEEHLARAARSYAAILPTVLQVIEDEVRLRLSHTIDPLLQRTTHTNERTSSLIEGVAPALARVCQELAASLNCIEVSVFVEDYFDAPGEYRLAATTAPELINKRSYKASVDEGMTGWHLAHPEANVVVFDLGESEQNARRFPGLRWMDSIDLRRRLADLGLTAAHPLPPLSFMSSPIMDGERVAGILRCSVGLGPMYFAEPQHAMLRQTSARVGAALNALVRTRSFETLVEHVKDLNEFAYAELMKAAPDENRIIETAIGITRRVVPDLHRVDVQILHENAETWHEPPSNSDTGAMLLAPLRLGADTFGVLSAHSATGRPFPDFAVSMTGLLVSQLALYQRLAITVRDLKRLIRDLNDVRELQIRIYEDLSHQLKSPTITAYRRIDTIVRRMPESPLKMDLMKVRGVCARAMHVTAAAGVFVRLARNEDIPVTRTSMTGEELLRLAINTAHDASYIVRGDQKHSFDARADGFQTIGAINIDRSLLEQALTQLLDNAFKYSYSDSVVIVTAGITRSGERVRISISDEGIPLRPSDVALCIQRGWQSEDARSASDTGSGIGLWVVDKIMRAQGGMLEVTPTDRATGRTTFSLLFPR